MTPRRWLVLAFAALAVNLFALAYWRYSAAHSGRPDALLSYKPSPLQADYAREMTKYQERYARWEAEGAPADQPDIYDSYRDLQEQYQDLTADETARYRSAILLEFEVIVVSVFAGGLAGFLAVIIFFTSGGRPDPEQRTDA